MTLLVIPSAASTPQPIVAAVGNAASYDTHAIAPGEIIVIYGSNLGPATLVPAAVTPDGGYLTESLAVNSSINPAQAGSIVVLYATGEGVTSPPGVDGRLSSDIDPTPVDTCAVTTGG